MKIGRGSIVLVQLDPTIGHEQHGVRPCVVVSDPEIISNQRFPMIGIVPITSTPGFGLLYPPLAPGSSGLSRLSFALVDQLRAIDKQRIRRISGQISFHEIAAIEEGLAFFLGFGKRIQT